MANKAVAGPSSELHRRYEVIPKSGWFAARPSGTEDIYKIYAESFSGAHHLLQRILTEA